MFDSCRNLTYNMTHEIGIRIIQGHYNENNNFPTEAALSEEFGVSRNVTREAIKILTAKGLIASRPRKGISVMPVANWNLFDSDILHWTMDHAQTTRFVSQLHQLRLAIEPEAARLICYTQPASGRHHISTHLHKMKLNAQNRQKFTQAQIDFHHCILTSCDNPYFENFHELVAASIGFEAEARTTTPDYPQKMLNQYQHLVDNIQKGDATAAANQYREILDAKF